MLCFADSLHLEQDNTTIARSVCAPSYTILHARVPWFQALALHRALRQDVTAAKRELADLAAWHRHNHAAEVRAVGRAVNDDVASMVSALRKQVQQKSNSERLARQINAERAELDRASSDAHLVEASTAQIQAQHAVEVGWLKKRCQLLATQVGTFLPYSGTLQRVPMRSVCDTTDKAESIGTSIFPVMILRLPPWMYRTMLQIFECDFFRLHSLVASPHCTRCCTLAKCLF